MKMDLRFTEKEIAFRDEVRAFFRENLPESIRTKLTLGKHFSRDDMVTWMRILNAKGWAAPHWPEEHGGTGWDPVQQYIFREELLAAPAPEPLSFGVSMVGPVIYTFGNQKQKDYFLPRIRNMDDWWCQGFSEPGAGSDLASLKTRAVREGDHYIVNGQKTWTTLGQYANWIFCLVRTDPDAKAQEGISFLLIDMDTPGIEVRPIILLDGTHEVNEVWFTDVKVPVENLVGEENKGWTYAKYLLQHERVGIANVGASTAAMGHLKDIAGKQTKHGRPLLDDPYFAAKMARIEIDLESMKTTNLRVLSEAKKGGSPGIMSSMLKIKGSVIRQEINALTREALGPWALPYVSEALDEGSNVPAMGPDYANGVASEYFNHRKISIYGGSNEIQRGIIAKAALGL